MTFPYPDDSFDLVILTSVFTHIRREELENYLRQVQRVLAPGGRVFVTFFLINDTSREHMQMQAFRFHDVSDGSYFMDARVTSANVAYDESDIDRLVAEHGFLTLFKFYGGVGQKRRYA